MRFTLAWIPLLTGLLLAAPTLADDDSDRGRGRVYEVTVTNVTKGQTFTPILVATHSPGVELFQVGESASRQLEILAEDGNTGPLADALADQGRRVGDVTTIDGLLDPGRTAKVRVRASRRHSRISLAAMLIPTNDTFFAVNGARLPYFGTNALSAPGYDAGTEENDQDCANIPGPVCGGEGFSEEPGPGDEGFIFIGNGFHELDANDDRVLGPFTYDWRNPVARVTVRRVH